MKEGKKKKKTGLFLGLPASIFLIVAGGQTNCL